MSKMVSRTCPQCGQQFDATVSRANRAQNISAPLIDERATRYEIYRENGTVNKALTRRRAL